MSHPLQTAVTLHQRGQLEAARPHYEAFLEAEPDHPQAHNLLGILHMQAGRVQAAVTHLRRAVALSPQESAFQNNLGNALRAAGDAAGARAAWQTSVRLDPSSADGWCNLGVAAMEGGDMPTAVAHWQTALRHAPRHVEALNLLSVHLSQTGAWTEAIAKWRVALSEQPSHRGVRQNLAAALRQQGGAQLEAGRIEDARALAEEAVALAPDELRGWMLLGNLHHRSGDLRQAFAAMQRALSIDPNRHEIHHNIGNLLKESGQNDQALRAFRRAQELGSTHPATQLAIDALTGTTPQASTAAVVRELFDNYADRFDTHLQETLHYQTPTSLRAMAGDAPVGRLLDMGCGTGLSGAAFRDLAEVMVGVDLSEKMIAVAERKGLYQELYAQDILTYLTEEGEPFELFVAADTLVYLGDLRPVFEAVARRSAPGARWLFSVERLVSTEVDYRFQTSERFAHREGYIQHLASETGFQILESRIERLRKDGENWIEGLVFHLQREEPNTALKR